MNKQYSLGIEFSTQSVKIVVLDMNKHNAVYKGKFDYDVQFPRYNTKGGVLRLDNDDIRHTSPFMLIEAIELTFKKLAEEKIDLGKIAAVKVDAMQHCTVYTDKHLSGVLSNLDPQKDLIQQLKPIISRQTSPIWEDRSPVKEAEYLTRELSSQGGINNITGNKAELRFPGPQVMKWAKGSADEYNNTAYIFLLSAFITSVLSGTVAGVDTGDGWGTNLNTLDINNPDWSNKVLEVIDSYLGVEDAAEGEGNKLGEKIGTIIHYDQPIGKVSDYFVKKYNLDPNAVILAGTGDNPATLLGCGGGIVLSLGSSYTVNGVMTDIKPAQEGEYNVFGYTKGTAMSLTCFSNGGKLHEEFLCKYVLKSEQGQITADIWAEYAKLAGPDKIGEDEPLMLPYLMAETVPLRNKGIVRDGFDAEDARTNIRALHISQVLALKLHSKQLSNEKQICIVGGASGNKFFRQLITDAFGASSYIIKNADFAAPFGCALAAARYALDISYEQAVDIFVEKEEGSTLAPNKENTDIFQGLVKRYSELEGT